MNGFYGGLNIDSKPNIRQHIVIFTVQLYLASRIYACECRFQPYKMESRPFLTFICRWPGQCPIFEVVHYRFRRIDCQ